MNNESFWQWTWKLNNKHSHDTQTETLGSVYEQWVSILTDRQGGSSVCWEGPLLSWRCCWPGAIRGSRTLELTEHTLPKRVSAASKQTCVLWRPWHTHTHTQAWCLNLDMKVLKLRDWHHFWCSEQQYIQSLSGCSQLQQYVWTMFSGSECLCMRCGEF